MIVNSKKVVTTSLGDTTCSAQASSFYSAGTTRSITTSVDAPCEEDEVARRGENPQQRSCQ